MIEYAYLIPLFPLLGWLITGLFGKKLSKTAVSIVACGTIFISFVIALGVFFQLNGLSDKEHTLHLFDWINSGKFTSAISFLIDPLSVLFLLIITGIGFLIHVYSAGYMKEDEGLARFFSYLNLFVFFMLLLVMGNNYLLMFVGWEGVGLCSYLLIGFWFKNTEYNKAANKAFIMNRVGDLGFILGIILIFITFGSVTYGEVFKSAASFASDETVMITITMLLFIGAMGKSAQIPLFTWLPDAMAGPTPVSALIHAATMVTAGIYMVARSNILYTLAPTTMEVVAVVGLITCLFAATIGLFQNDIKKVLAYSTVSQLGIMFLGLGVGAYTGAVFHVMTHAFFKALLFLAAGSVIHALHHEQDIRNMGGLRKYIRITFITFAIGTIAIAGIPPLSGFFSKDEILAHVYAHNKFYWLLGLVGSFMTAFYMFRLLFLTFFGKFRGSEEQEHHIHESPKTMTIPLMILAGLSVIGGFFGLPEITGMPHTLNEYLSPVFERSEFRLIPPHLSHETEWSLILLAVVIAGAAIYMAYHFFVKKEIVPVEDEEITSGVHKTIYNKFYVDELYNALFTKPLNAFSGFADKVLEINVIDGIVNGMGSLVKWSSGIFRLAQSGFVGVYLLIMVLGVAIMLFLKLM
jgi:NADH-quinone oxidoreductase subunit L